MNATSNLCPALSRNGSIPKMIQTQEACRGRRRNHDARGNTPTKPAMKATHFTNQCVYLTYQPLSVRFDYTKNWVLNVTINIVYRLDRLSYSCQCDSSRIHPVVATCGSVEG